MKKFISGLLVGMALMLTGSVFAADIQSMIGKAIQGQFGVTVDGKPLEMPAIVVDGTSFLPVRSFGESVGYAVYFDAEGAIRLEKQAQPLVGYEAAKQAAKEKLDKAKEENLKQIKAEEQAAAKIRAEGDAEAAMMKAELDRRAQEAAKQQQAQQQQAQPQPSLTK